jgi:hypothetical protein
MARPTRRERPRTGGRASRLGDRLLITARARKALRRLCAEAGRQHLVLTWPGGANYLPAAMHHAGPYDVVVGHVARCPIYADLRQLDLFRTRYMLIDVNDCAHPPGRPLLNTTHHPHAHNQAGRPARLVASAGGAVIGRRLRRARRREPGAANQPAQSIPSIIHRVAGQIMADQAEHRNVEVSDGDRLVASAQVTASPDAATSARASLHGESGHLPTGSRARLVDAVLDLPELQGSTHLEATVPLGDTESLQRLRERTDHMTTRAAGASALVEADLRPIDRPGSTTRNMPLRAVMPPIVHTRNADLWDIAAVDQVCAGATTRAGRHHGTSRRRVTCPTLVG